MIYSCGQMMSFCVDIVYESFVLKFFTFELYILYYHYL